MNKEGHRAHGESTEGTEAKPGFLPTHNVIGGQWSGQEVEAGGFIKQSDFRYITLADGMRSVVHVDLLKPVTETL